ncbi:MAG: T9SS type A sorting domain-containing protein [Bacteroidetes bacterium]|nr:T9SS type A sorting domain-containing protein [Bacteroidota bacterium]
MKKFYVLILLALLCTVSVSYAQPANDNCSGAITLTQTTTCSAINGTTVGASQSIAAIICNGTTGTADDDVWYKFVAVSTNPTIKVVGSTGFDAKLELHESTCSGTLVNCADANGTGGTETISASNLTIGTLYYVRVYSWGSLSSSQGTFTICLYGSIPTPANNNCSGAITLTQTTTASPVNGTTQGATQSVAAITCGTTGTADDDVWYKFVAGSTNPTIQVTGGTGFDPVVDLRSGSCNGTNISCADANASGGTETINTTGLTIGTTYYIRVYGWGSSSSSQGAFTISVYGVMPTPANDACSAAITLTQTSTASPVNGTTITATQSIAAITCGTTGTADDDVWYKFVAGSTNPTIQVTGSSTFDAVVDLRSGSCTGTNIACADANASGGTETINATGLTIGSTYYIRVYSWGSLTSSQGTFTISVYGVMPAPANDACSGAITLTQTTTCSPTNGTTMEATQSLAAITCVSTGTADDDVWFKFVATSTTPTIKVVGSSTFDAVVDLRSGSCSTGTNISCADANSSGGTETISATGLTIGTTYYIRVYSWGSSKTAQGTFTICVYGASPCTTPGSPTNIQVTPTQTGASFTWAAPTTPVGSPTIVYYWMISTSSTPNWSNYIARCGDAGGFSANTSGTGTCASPAGMPVTLTPSTTYYLHMYARTSCDWTQSAWAMQQFTTLGSGPANNNCGDAITLTQGTSCGTPTNGTTVGATQSIAAITCDGATGTADDDVWYKFVATTATPTIKVVGATGFDAILDLHSGTCSGPSIGCSDTSTSGGTEAINATGLTIGSTYYVRVYSYGSASSAQGTFTICVYGTLPAPANDDCSGAIALTQSASCAPTNGTTVGATQSIAAITCASYTGTADDDVWYKFDATSVNPTIEVVGLSTFDPVVDLRSGSCSSGTNLNCADASFSGGTETINATGLTIGTTYYIRIYSYGSSESQKGAFTVCVYGAGGSTIPTVTTTAPSTTGNTTATSGGNVTNQGSTPVTARGVCWATTANPVVTLSHTVDASGIGIFTSSITGLSAGTLYHVRAYATNTAGTAYGNDETFTTTGTPPNLPTVTTTTISAITSNSASGGGEVTSDGGAAVTARGVCWALSANPTITTAILTIDGAGIGAFTSSLTGLAVGTLYHVRAYATNSAGTAYGSDLSFTTTGGSAAIPTVITTGAYAITTSSASSGGDVTADGGSPVTARGVCWSTNPNPDLSAPHSIDGNGTGTFISSITGLTANTSYHVRAYATNSTGTAYGNDVSFTTEGNANATLPIVSTDGAYSIGNSFASAGGNVASDGGDAVTNRGVCYAITANPDISGTHTNDGLGIGSFTSALTGLLGNTTYHIRAFATNSIGTAYGSDLNFTTTNVGIIQFSANAENISIYPNPTKDQVSIEFELSSPENVTLTIHNYLSQQIFTENFTNHSGSFKKTIDLSGFGMGVYFLKIQIGENDYSKKIVVVK